MAKQKLITDGSVLTPTEMAVAELEADIDEREARIAALESDAFEDWVGVADDLDAIRTKIKKARENKEMVFGCTSWGQYCESERSRCTKQHANALIRYATCRRLLPEPEGAPSGWSQNAVKAIDKLQSPDSLKRSVGRQIVAYCEKNKKPITETIAKQYVDKAKDTKAYRKAEEKKAEQAAKECTPVRNLKRLFMHTKKHLLMLQNQDEKFWSDVEAEAPGLTTRVAEALGELASFLMEE